jgi:expansin (peptidoglycan-binding protein)
MYKTYCGYCGTKTGKRDTTSNYPCAIGQIQNTVQHMSTPHFAAFPQNFLEQGKYCGMCVEVTYMRKTITATVVDACGSCMDAGHLDLSLSAAEALGMTEFNGNPDTGVSWKTVACPVTENIYVRYNGGERSQPYFQNTAFPVASAKVGSQSAQINTGFWMFQGQVGGQVVTLTDTMGHTIQGTMPTATEGGSLGVQFPLTCE